MASREQDALGRRYAELIDEICLLIEHGRPPWWNSTAQQGPAMLGRSGQSLRGLPAVIAWHVGNSDPKRPLAWRLRPESETEMSRAAVLRLPANGGDALYAAVPDPRPREIQDSPHDDFLAYWPVDRLDAQLSAILTSLGTMAPDLDHDRAAIVSLAQAFIRPLGEQREPTPMDLGRQWMPGRLIRVATWARLLADDIRLDIFRPRFTRDMILQCEPPASSIVYDWRWQTYADVPKQLCHEGWLQQSLPAEVREKYHPQAAVRRNDSNQSHLDARYLVPEKPVRESLFYGRRKRSPGLRRLVLVRHQIPSFIGPEQYIAWAMYELGWRDKAALGISLAAALGGGAIAFEPGMAWRMIGRTMRAAMQERTRIASIEHAIDLSETRGFWRKLWQHHAHKTWFHPTTKAPLRTLVASGRWQRQDLEELLHQRGVISWSDGGKDYAANYLPVVKVATLRRSKKQIFYDEPDTLAAIAHALQCKPYWTAVTNAAESATWQRYKRAKISGGVRWLDIPSDTVRAAQRIVSDLLFAVTPSYGTPTGFHPGASPALHARAHAGAYAAVRVDLADFFGSVRPWHLKPWLGLDQGGRHNLLPQWSIDGRQSLMVLLFRRIKDVPSYLPQGAPCSPAAANLAGLWLDQAIVSRAVEVFGTGRVTYTRYADDLVISARGRDTAANFNQRAYELINDAVAGQKWRLQPFKTRAWTYRDGEALHICGLRVPRKPSQPLTLGRDLWRRARAALHQMRHRADLDGDRQPGPAAAHGLLAYAYSATGDLRWLAYASCRLLSFARRFAGPLFSESFLAGWSDMESVGK